MRGLGLRRPLIATAPRRGSDRSAIEFACCMSNDEKIEAERSSHLPLKSRDTAAAEVRPSPVDMAGEDATLCRKWGHPVVEITTPG